MADLILTLGGEPHLVSFPTRFAEREELVFAVANHAPRGCAACLGLCCPSLYPSGAEDYKAANYNALDFGGRVYSTLREEGHSAASIIEAGIKVFKLLQAALYPRAVEVSEAVDFTEASAAPPTSLPCA